MLLSQNIFSMYLHWIYNCIFMESVDDKMVLFVFTSLSICVSICSPCLSWVVPQLLRKHTHGSISIYFTTVYWVAFVNPTWASYSVSKDFWLSIYRVVQDVYFLDGHGIIEFDFAETVFIGFIIDILFDGTSLVIRSPATMNTAKWNNESHCIWLGICYSLLTTACDYSVKSCGTVEVLMKNIYLEYKLILNVNHSNLASSVVFPNIFGSGKYTDTVYSSTFVKKSYSFLLASIRWGFTH